MSKVFIEKLTEFTKAAYELSKVWDDLDPIQHEIVAEASYPFAESFDVTAANIGDWAQQAIEGLEMTLLQEQFKSTVYCMALEDNGVTENGWFLKCNLRGRTLTLEEEIDGHLYYIDVTEFKNNFIQVDKSLYELAVKANMYSDMQAVEKIQELARYFGGPIDEL